MDAYLINMDRSPDRLEFFARQASAAGVEFERVSGVDGQLLTEDEFAESVSSEFEFQPINAAQIGNFLSHRVVWEKLVESGAPRAAIFEDDAVLSPSMGDVLKSIDDSEPEFDLIKLETTLRPVVCERSASPLAAGTELRKLLTWHGGTAGYVISASCAKRLLKLKKKVADVVDQAMFNPMSRVSSQFSIAQIHPAICIQNDLLAKHSQSSGKVFGSTIERNASRKLLRFGVYVDVRRMVIKQREKLRRKRLARVPSNHEQVVPFAGVEGITYRRAG